MAVATLVFARTHSDDWIARASMATAYGALGLLAIALAIGPVATLRGRRYPVGTMLRRDIGLWSAVIAVVHVIIGLQVHMRGQMASNSLSPSQGTPLPRVDPFGIANYTGAAAALILGSMLATSNDWSLRRLGAMRWRRVHAYGQWALVLRSPTAPRTRAREAFPRLRGAVRGHGNWSGGDSRLAYTPHPSTRVGVARTQGARQRKKSGAAFAAPLSRPRPRCDLS